MPILNFFPDTYSISTAFKPPIFHSQPCGVLLIPNPYHHLLFTIIVDLISFKFILRFINPIPKEMTFDEYQDMNRRLNVGLLLAAIPIPGMIHHYAGEQKIAKNIRWVAAGSILAIIGGAVSMKEDGWKGSPYEIYIENQGTNDEKRYQKIPIGETGGEIDYKYVELEKQYSGAFFLVPLGISVLIGDYLYDYIYGI